MKVENFQPEDKPVFLQLCEEFYSAEATLRPFCPDVASKTFDRVVDKHENLWGVMLTDAETDEKIGYGLITSYWCNEEGGNVLVLDELYISPKNRHKGYGKLFMEWLEGAYKNYAVSITLEVLTTNSRAVQLYTTEGYAPDGFAIYSKRING